MEVRGNCVEACGDCLDVRGTLCRLCGSRGNSVKVCGDCVEKCGDCAEVRGNVWTEIAWNCVEMVWKCVEIMLCGDCV